MADAMTPQDDLCECGHPQSDHHAGFCGLCTCGYAVDPLHSYTCDVNLYPEYRDDPDLCNIGCLERPEEVIRSRAFLNRQPTE